LKDDFLSPTLPTFAKTQNECFQSYEVENRPFQRSSLLQTN